jgi:hypothetical protein
MADDRIAELEARIRALESERRRGRLQWLGTGLGALALAVLTGFGALGVARAQSSPAKQTVEAREFIIRDVSGEIAFYVGPEKDGVVLFLRDRNGRVTARLPFTTELIPLSPR